MNKKISTNNTIFAQHLKTNTMIKNFLKIAIRNLRKHLGFSAINIFGLALGLSIAVLILLWVKYEFSYNNMHEKKDRIYRLGQTQIYSSGPLKVYAMPGPLAAQIKADFPEIEDAFRCEYSPKTIRFNDKTFNEEILYSDKEIFNLFDFEFIRGDAETALSDFNSIVITDKMAKKYFNDDNPIGKILILNDLKSFKVSAVIKDSPKNSNLRFDFCIPFEHISEIGFDYTVYGSNWIAIYVLLKEGANKEDVNAKIENYFKIVKNQPESTTTLWLWPLSKIHLYSPRGGGLIKTIRLFIAIAFFILIIACINFMNLATAKSTLRSKEIGLRKVLGAGRKNIIVQFFGESLLMAFLAMIVALFIVQLILPAFNLIAERELTFNFANTEIIGGIIILIIITGFIAGSYPALYLSSFRPITILKGIIVKGKSGAIFRKSLVVFQFSLSIILIIGSIIIYQQQKYLLSKDIGLDKDNVIVIRMQGEVNNKFNSLKPLLLQNPQIESVSRSSHLPIMIGSNTGSITWDGRDDDNDLLVGFTTVDNDFEKAVGFEMVEGRFFSDEYGTDSASVVLNESAVKFMNLKNPIGRWIQWGQGEEARFPVIGVVKDFNFENLSENVSPMALFYGQSRCRYIFIKSNNKNIIETANSIEATWNEVFPTYPFEYTLLNDRYVAMYASEEKTGSLFKYFTILAILISCLGLFGLASYMAEQKTKEIGIKKVLGASESNIVYKMAIEFIKWVIIANIIAWPISWYFGKQFLDQYANKSELGISIFIISGIASIIVALFTISYQSFKAAKENPINALRHE